MWIRETENGTEMTELLQAAKSGKMLKRIQVLEDGRVPAKKARSCRIEGQKRKVSREEYHRQINKWFHGPERIWESR